MYQPERERLDTLLRRVQVHQPLDQGAFCEPCHRAASAAVGGFRRRGLRWGLDRATDGIRVPWYHRRRRCVYRRIHPRARTGLQPTTAESSTNVHATTDDGETLALRRRTNCTKVLPPSDDRGTYMNLLLSWLSIDMVHDLSTKTPSGFHLFAIDGTTNSDLCGFTWLSFRTISTLYFISSLKVCFIIHISFIYISYIFHYI